MFSRPRPALFRIASAAVVAASAALLAPAAFADTAQVRIGDLDLTTASGKATLSKRIDAAARSVCQQTPPTGTRIRDRNTMRECVADVHRQIETRLATRAGSPERGR